MPPVPKRPPRVPAKAPSKAATKAAAAGRVKRAGKVPSGSSKPFLRFYHSESLRRKTLAVLSLVETAEDGTEHRDALADIVMELTDSGMDYFFLRPLELAKTGFLIQQSAKLGMSGTTSVLSAVIHNIIGRMDEAQLLAVCAYLRQLMK